MHILLVNLKVKADCVETFTAATLKNARASRCETGIVSFELLADKKDPCSFLLYEVYTQPEAQQLHRLTEHYKQWKEATADMFESPAVRNVYDYVEKG